MYHFKPIFPYQVGFKRCSLNGPVYVMEISVLKGTDRSPKAIITLVNFLQATEDFFLRTGINGRTTDVVYKLYHVMQNAARISFKQFSFLP